MGLGKTAQAIRAAESARFSRILVICPAMVRGVWREELQRWTTRAASVQVLRSGAETPLPLGPDAPARWYVASYEYVARHRDRFSALDLVILDEAHYLKGTLSRRTMAILGRGQGLVHRTGCAVWALSGTPTPNHPGELYPVLVTLGGVPHGLSYVGFIRRYCQLDELGRPVGLRRKTEGELQAGIAHVVLRRTKASVGMQLPPVSEATIRVPSLGPTPDQIAGSPLEAFAALGAGALERELAEGRKEAERWLLAGGEALAGGSLATLRVWLGLRRVDAVVRLIADELERGEYRQLLAFAWHRDVIRLVAMGLRERGILARGIRGDTSPSSRDYTMQEWRAGRCPVLVGQIQTMGTGLTLTETSHVLMAESAWTDDANQQAIARAHRIGAGGSSLSVRYVVLEEEPFEEALMGVVRRKRSINRNLWTNDTELVIPRINI